MSARRGVVNLKKHRLFGLAAQSTVEYAVLFACVVAALIGMQFYIKRGTQGRFREASDSIGAQYAPKSVNSEITTTVESTIEVKQELVPLKDAGGVDLVDQNKLPIYGKLSRLIFLNHPT